MSNVQIIPTNTNGAKKPESLMNAISEVQQYYVMESQGEDIPSAFFTMEMYLSFIKIGFKTALLEGWLFCLVGLGYFFILPLICYQFKPLTSYLCYMPFMLMVVNTILCMCVGRYYEGNLTKKIVSSLIWGRLSGLCVMALLIYAMLTFIEGLGTPTRIAVLVKYTGIIFKHSHNYFYTFFNYKPFSVNEISIVILALGLIPFLWIFIFTIIRKFISKRRLAKVFTQGEK